MTRQRGDLKQEDDRKGASTAEVVMIVTSVLVTLTLFSYVVFQAVTAPDGPHLTVEQKRVETKADSIEVHVLLRNQGNVGVRSVEVEIPCDDPPPSVTFENVPAHGVREAVIACPVDAEELQPEVSTWVKM